MTSWLSLLLGWTVLPGNAIDRPGGVLGNDAQPLVVLNWYSDFANSSQFSISDIDRFIISRKIPYKQLVINHAYSAPNKKTCAMEVVDWEMNLQRADDGYGLPSSGQSDPNLASGALGALMMLKQVHPKVFILSSLGGQKRSHSFRTCIQADKREAFTDSLIEYLNYFRFDGVNFDWQHPDCVNCGCSVANCPDTPNDSGEGDWKVYIEFLKYLKQRLTSASDSFGRYLWLTISVGADPAILEGDSRYKTPVPFEVLCADDSPVDWINLGTLGFFGTWTRYTGPLAGLDNSPISSYDNKKNIQYGLDSIKPKCADKSKLLIGLASDGRAWKGIPKDGDPPGLFKTSTFSKDFAATGTYEDGAITYQDIMTRYAPVCERSFDMITQTPSLYCDMSPSGEEKVFVAYDDHESWAAKAKRARDYGMSGAQLLGYGDAKVKGGATEWYGELFKGLLDGWSGDSSTVVRDPPEQIVCPTPLLAWEHYSCPFDKECLKDGCEKMCDGVIPGSSDEVIPRPDGALECIGNTSDHPMAP